MKQRENQPVRPGLPDRDETDPFKNIRGLHPAGGSIDQIIDTADLKTRDERQGCRFGFEDCPLEYIKLKDKISSRKRTRIYERY